MDAGLSFNQGMVVGRYHSVKILPGILGVRSNTRSAEGNLYIRSDDLLKSMGWREKEISNLVRHISLENAIVHSQILKYSGIGPDKTGLNESFKSIVKVTHVRDGDTFEVEDVIYSGEKPLRYAVRFDGINAAELVKFGTGKASDGTSTAFINQNSSAGQAMRYVEEAVKGKLIVLRTNPKDPAAILAVDNAYEPGSAQNIPGNYATAYKSGSYADAQDRYMSTVFATTDSNVYENVKQELRSIFVAQQNSQFAVDFKETIKENVKKKFYQDSIMFINFNKIYNSLDGMSDLLEHFTSSGNSDPLNSLTQVEIRHFNVLMNILLLNELYEKASEWPIVSWDEYYEDGRPVTLNWELVSAGLAQVYMTGTQYAQKSVETPKDYIPQLVPSSEFTVRGAT
jgi:endonuclease YncB( thermonuclease family)